MDINWISILVKCKTTMEKKNKMKKQGIRIIISIIVAIFLATIGTVLVNAEIEDETEDCHLLLHDRGEMFIHSNFDDELTDDLQAEIDDLIISLNEEGATNEEIREAISAKLDELGILDERLNNAIEQTEQRLEILNRENELRDQGYSWKEIN